MEKKWVLKTQPKKESLKGFNGYSNFLKTMLYQRGVKTMKEAKLFFSSDYEKGLNDSYLLSGMQEGVERIISAIEKKEKIAVYGDYDADGVTAASVINQFFLELGIKPLVYIPDRVKEGYGLNEKAIEYLKAKKIQLVITVDTGIRNASEVDFSSELGMDVIITDHHIPPKKLPRAKAIIDPHLDKGTYPTCELAGVGVAFKLVQALIKKIGEKKFSLGFEKWLLDYVAIGTIADIVPLIGENRTLTRFGLIVISKTRRLGLRALLENSGISFNEPIDSLKVAFRIAPRINAAGRMDHANNAFILLNADSKNEAEKLATQLETQNTKRQTATEKIIKKILKNDLETEKIIIERGKEFPLGIVGLAAGRLCDKYCRPALVINETGGKLRGSARSIPEFNIVKALEEISSLLEEYGGHKQAAGFTLLKRNYKKFKEKLLIMADKEIKTKDLIPKIRLDYQLDFSEINSELLKEMKKLEPFGCRNPEPIFKLKGVKVATARFVGKNNNHYKLSICKNENNGGRLVYHNCIWFNPEKNKAQEISPGAVVDIAFNLDINYFNGRGSIEIKVIDIKKK